MARGPDIQTDPEKFSPEMEQTMMRVVDPGKATGRGKPLSINKRDSPWKNARVGC